MNQFAKVSLLTASLVMLGTLAEARELYVSPTGSSSADGSKSAPLDIFTALSAKSPATPGDTIYLMGGTYDGKMDGIKRVPFVLAVSGAGDKPIRVMPVPGQSAHLNGTVTITGSHVEYRGLDIGDLDWDPTQKKHVSETAANALDGSNAKLINCNIFGGAMGTGLWSPAINFEVYGCLVHDFGTFPEGVGRGHGHAFYAQNTTGTKVIEHNIAYRGAGWNLHLYTQEGEVQGFDVRENIMYIAGAQLPNKTLDNYLIAGRKPLDRINVIGNIGYQPSVAEGYRPNMRVTSYKDNVNGTAVVKDNYLIGAVYGLSLGKWKNIQIEGNTIGAKTIFVEISQSSTGTAVEANDTKPDLGGFKADRNTFIENGEAKPFQYGKDGEKDRLSFADWQKLGLDKSSSVVTGKDGKPTSSKTFVFPNKYTKGRAQVAIFDWNKQEKAEVDLSNVLTKGQRFRIYNCLDIKQTIARAKPVLGAQFDGSKVMFPLRHDAISPDFDAFLVLPVE